MNKILLTITLLLFALLANAQTDKKLDVVQLKNGGTFRGEIQEQADDSKIVLLLPNNNELTFQVADIERVLLQGLIEVKPFVPESQKVRVRKPRTRIYEFEDEGIYFVVSTLMANGKREGKFNFGMGAQFTAGYRFSYLLGVGMGMGINNYEIGTGRPITPAFLEVRGYFQKKIATPYYAIAGGYGFAQKYGDNLILEAEGGYFLYPALGYRFTANKKANFQFDIGYNFQEARYKSEIPWTGSIVNEQLSIKRFALRAGLIF